MSKKSRTDAVVEEEEAKEARAERLPRHPWEVGGTGGLVARQIVAAVTLLTLLRDFCPFRR